MKKNTRKKRASKGKGYPKVLDWHLEKIAFVVDLSADPEGLIRYVLARFKETSDVWTVYEVVSLDKIKSTKNPFRFYCYLFILSALAYLYLQKSDQEEPGTPEELSLDANEPIYGSMVTYLHNVKGVEIKKKATGYLAIPLELRGSICTMFKFIRDERGSKYSHIELLKGIIVVNFHFFDVNDFPVEVLAGQSQIAVDNSAFPETNVNAQTLSDLIHMFCQSRLWIEWEELPKVRQKNQKQKVIAEKLSYFKQIEKVLQTEITENNKSEDSIWFRPCGPLAIDFKDNKVHVNDAKVEALKNHVLNHKISKLESLSGTGKTVLARSLAWKLYSEEEHSIFHLDCNSEKDFLSTELIDEFESTEGIFVIENAHLNPFVIGKALSCLNHLTNRHVLFTSIPMPKEKTDLCFHNIKIQSFSQPKPFEDADSIIEKYCLNTIEQPMPFNDQKEIKNYTSNNYKMLAYALSGYVSKDGKGTSKEWLESGVAQEFLRLECLAADQQESKERNRIYPETLLALAPLYINEVLTAERYLIDNLNFDKKDFQALDLLVERGEAISHRTMDGYMFYGLPHSSQANAYWCYGGTYRERKNWPEYEDFIYNYVSAGNSNGLSAVLKTESDVQNRVLKRLSENNLLTHAIQKELSLGAIGAIVELCEISEDQLIPILLKKVKQCEEPFFYAREILKYLDNYCKKYNRDIFELLDYQNLCRNFITYRGIEHLAYYILPAIGLKDIIHKFLSRLDSGTVQHILESLSGLDALGFFFRVIEDFNDDEIKKHFLSLLVPLDLAKKLESMENAKQICASIKRLTCLESKALEVCQKVNPQAIAKIFNESPEAISVCNGLWYFKRIYPDLVLEIWQNIDIKQLISKCIKESDSVTFLSLIEIMLRLHPSIAEDVCDNIRSKVLIDSLKRDVVSLCKLFMLISKADRTKSGNIWKRISLEWLADELKNRSDITVLTDSLRYIESADSEKYAELIKYFDDEWLVLFLNGIDEADSVLSFLHLICSFDPDHAQRVWKLMNQNILFNKVGKISDINRLRRCQGSIAGLSSFLEVDSISFRNPILGKMAESIMKADINDAALFLAVSQNIENSGELFQFLGKEYILSIFNKGEDLNVAIGVFRRLSECNPTIAKKVAKSFKLRSLAKKIGSEVDFYDTVMFAYWLRRIHPRKAKRLWEEINLKALGSKVGTCPSDVMLMESMGRLASIDKLMAGKLIREFPTDDFEVVFNRMTNIYRFQMESLIKKCDEKLYNQMFPR